MNHVGEKIRKQREELGLSQDSLAKALGYRSRSSIAKIEAGVTNMAPEKLSAAAEVLQVSPLYLLGLTEHTFPDISLDNLYPIHTKLFPLLGEIACGEPIFAEEQHESYIEAGSDIHADFCLRAKGDSMIGARIYDGDIVFIRKQSDVLDGEIAAVLIGDEATLKRVYKMPHRIQLRAENPAYPPLDYEGIHCKEVRILGKAVAFQGIVR